MRRGRGRGEGGAAYAAREGRSGVVSPALCRLCSLPSARRLVLVSPALLSAVSGWAPHPTVLAPPSGVEGRRKSADIGHVAALPLVCSSAASMPPHPNGTRAPAASRLDETVFSPEPVMCPAPSGPTLHADIA